MHFLDHVAECRRKLGDDPQSVAIYEEVNRLIDQFAHYPDPEHLQVHRQFLHHAEGIAYFGRRFGPLGEQAARLHVLADCGWIPTMADYHNGVADNFGGRRTPEHPDPQ